MERFRGAIAERLGLHFDESQHGLLAKVLQQRSEERGVAVEAYLRDLESPDAAGAEIGALAGELTVAETYFNRNQNHFLALRDVALPDRMHVRMRLVGEGRKLRILSAGCASGEEPFSIAMLLRDSFPTTAGSGAEILAIDVNPAAIAKAHRGRYTGWALRETPDEMRSRWFRDEGRTALLDETIRGDVRFVEKNLLDDDPAIWPPEHYDVVFCRNVVMYLTPDRARTLIERITRSLVPGGYLFLGHAETLRALSSDFHLRHTHETFYYQRREAFERRDHRGDGDSDASPLLAAEFQASTSWIETIGRASEKIRALTGTPQRPDAKSAAAIGSEWTLASAISLMREERYADALAAIDAFPAAARNDSDVLLLRAVLLLHRGNLEEAETACNRLLEVDELSAGAHYVMALCREGVLDRTGAAEHDRVAIYLDPAFAAPHLHLGLLARKGGDRPAAARSLSEALVLLEREDASRLLLFGGGFSREALVALCRAELEACGGPPR